MAGVPAESEVTDGHRGGRRTTKDIKLEENKEVWKETEKQRKVEEET